MNDAKLMDVSERLQQVIDVQADLCKAKGPDDFLMFTDRKKNQSWIKEQAGEKKFCLGKRSNPVSATHHESLMLHVGHHDHHMVVFSEAVRHSHHILPASEGRAVLTVSSVCRKTGYKLKGDAEQRQNVVTRSFLQLSKLPKHVSVAFYL